IALKHMPNQFHVRFSFGSIQNSIALKHRKVLNIFFFGFGSIQNSIALKPRINFLRLRNRTIRP
ncbi:hypothetical protein ABQE19_07625, partial [Enterococcus thailandicus]|uniref:hypothetical protein n=1 Tax=Enterococcus thailandicus TaxID=417368 RepID=UPI0032E38CBC